MKLKLSTMLLVLALASVPAFAQTGVAGKWIGELSAADGHGIAQPITVDLKLDGTTLSGTVTEGALEARPILSASVEGTAVTFRTTRNLGGSDINVNWKGELKGDDLAMTREIGPAPAEAGGGGRGGGGRGGGGAAPAAGGRGGGRGGAAAAAGGQRGAAAPAAAAPIPPVPATQNAETPDANAAAPAAAAGGRGGGQRGGGRGGAAPAAAGGAAPAAGGRGGAAAAAPGPTVSLTLHRSR